ncbi:hypothetical protein AR457_37290 [Streptomyces agglomeratus]|uniref:Uncharacterized protein n=1 Tax=Streptomyces agglomeratus TaxID=285458 RepID=A0A1E5NYV2_9ACTN|nr:hypothetical protein [Streptomyces agglomeratus]OEJ21458.1 hypothetical protein AS594_38520 [Streptomyces agglomeratus]OEJ22891.1 hypothetical protein AR457_37290 [Streptomyces agglomeratus]OEJ36469.1 hypothetical protein BGK72_37785 [Streptomyces agglomeratus]OEJ56518.1 hypothetical protein BGM19_38315 [Streptomyces agglomeratus]
MIEERASGCADCGLRPTVFFAGLLAVSWGRLLHRALRDVVHGRVLAVAFATGFAGKFHGLA